MPTQRKQFGKRGISHEEPVRRQVPPAASVPSFQPAGPAAAAISYEGTATSYEDEYSAGNFLWSLVVLFFSFRGRINRRGYWGLGLFNGMLQFAILFAYFGQFSLSTTDPEVISQAMVDGGHLLNLLVLLLVPSVSNISLVVRRFHDRDVSAYWIFSWFIPIIGTLICLFQSIANGFSAGTRGPNRFDTVQNQAHVFD